MDAVKSLAVNAAFSIIEKVYTGGYCYRARVDVKTLFAGKYLGSLPLVKMIHDVKFYHLKQLGLQRVLFSICETAIGERGEKWRARIGKEKIQFYFKDHVDLMWFSSEFSISIDEVSYPASPRVLDVLAAPALAKDEMIVYRPSLFFRKHRWRITLVRRTKWRGNDMSLLHDWVNDDLDGRLLSEQNDDAKLYISTQSDIELVRYGFNHLIRKIEKVTMHSELL